VLPEAARCQECGQRYARPSPEVVEIVSRRPHERLRGVSAEFWEGYTTARAAPLALTPSSSPWGASATAPPEWVRLRHLYSDRVVSLVLSLLDGRRSVVVDISAGAGYVSLELASKGVPTIHADLDPSSIAYAHNWVTATGSVHPLLAVRSDYFAVPLRRSADFIIATDTLIRGVAHELAVLRAIREGLAPDGLAVVDFHNWFHNPLRRMGLMPNNLQGNRSYARGEVRRLVEAAGLEIVAEHCYRQEEDQPGLRHAIAGLVPATRFLLVVQRMSRDARNN
jgi:SAM-dependent methyltransferase